MTVRDGCLCRRGTSSASRNGGAVSERESRRIIRQWNREIEHELRRQAAREAAGNRPWKAVSWTALWLLWLALLVALLGQVKSVG
jgi:hypothetical protein